MTRRASWEHITKNATEEATSWTLKQRAQFHYFNPNGLHAKMKAVEDEITKLVEADHVPTGWYLAYGTLGGCCYEESLIEMAMTDKRNITRIKYTVARDLYKEKIERAEAKVAEAKAEVASMRSLQDIVRECAKECNTADTFTYEQLDGLFEEGNDEPKDFQVGEYVENYKMSAIDAAANEAGIDWDEMNDLVCEAR